MANPFRVPMEEEYANLLGRAFYIFTYLEWSVISILVKLKPNGFNGLPRDKKGRVATSGVIANDLRKTIAEAASVLPESFRQRLDKFQVDFDRAVRRRNELIHAHPYTAEGGVQLLRYEVGPNWPPEEIRVAAQEFDALAVEGVTILHDQQLQVRPTARPRSVT